jgi:hypothetical protein
LAHKLASPTDLHPAEDRDDDARAVLRTFRRARVANPIIRALDGIEAMEILKRT